MIRTPYYLIDKTLLRDKLETVQYVRRHSGARVLLALKCFATWSVFDLMRDYMDGTTSSSLHEVKLGYTKFGGETHAYSVAFAEHEIEEVLDHSDKIIFNSIGQLERFGARAEQRGRQIGLRLNPRISASSFDLADPARPFSRLGEWDMARIDAVADRLDGIMIHNNCENRDFERFSQMLAQIEQQFGPLLSRLKWVSLGGGIHFTGEGYPLDDFCQRLRGFADTYGVQVYLEPGEAVVGNTTTLEVSVLDILDNGKQLAVVDSSVEAHMLDLLIYRLETRALPDQGPHRYLICGKSCLAGDVFGESSFPEPLKVGDRISLRDAGGYTMVKKNWFNGVQMPSIVIRELDGALRVVREFSFQDYADSLS
ncbi:MAG: carboxynorspermidine decarboxylase [Burkholderiaceae bacterium]